MTGDSTARPAGRWADLGARLGTAAGLAGTGIGAVYLGGLWFTAFAAAIAGLIVWELSRMAGAEAPVLLAVAAAACVVMLVVLPAGWGLPLAFVPLLMSAGRVARARLAHALFMTAVIFAAYGMSDLRDNFAPHWLVWLVLVVIATDVAGYFAGRLIGGPKFWPRLSPKKTWSGTVAGWVAAAGLGALAVWWGMAGPRIIAVSVALAMAAQLGDIAQSALKREVGVKDSSALLPGHGGFFDRFDGVLGAALFLLVVERLAAWPPPAGAE